MRTILKRGVLAIARRSKLVTDVAAFITRHADASTGMSSPTNARDTYVNLRERFIANGKGKPVNESVREQLVGKFERIDRELPIASTKTDGLFLAEMLLNMDAAGEIVECGSYAGGSSAKLSLVAKVLDRRLTVFDSFEGLPVAERYYLRDQHCRRSDAWVTDWTQGRYAARQDEVQGNIERYGDFSVCRLAKGWFNETLTPRNLANPVAFAFVDVDLADSARDCFTAIWPRLSIGGIYVTHDAAYIKVLQELHRATLWQEQFKSVPPILFGAGFGLCNDSPHLGYMVKGESLSSEYLKSLTIDK
ncbi:MAG TPA: TylF/MycF/NovP-related O-methyltransferase [Vicinamibacterales bacterium]|jgi:O-methyltransferase|nr:TylF/MycF/NovP-related O-methyltransferase [Vicinamibacterales bacterium]